MFKRYVRVINDCQKCRFFIYILMLFGWQFIDSLTCTVVCKSIEVEGHTLIQAVIFVHVFTVLSRIFWKLPGIRVHFKLGYTPAYLNLLNDSTEDSFSIPDSTVSTGISSPGPPITYSSHISHSNTRKTNHSFSNMMILIVNFQSAKNKKEEIGNLIDCKPQHHYLEQRTGSTVEYIAQRSSQQTMTWFGMTEDLLSKLWCDLAWRKRSLWWCSLSNQEGLCVREDNKSREPTEKIDNKSRMTQNRFLPNWPWIRTRPSLSGLFIIFQLVTYSTWMNCVLQYRI